ncbi:MAG TPA: hypothetical protein VFB38_01140 [Chthonomonadaceae bacterium]|nr:hypothetical protein [Chthonomonadaceae bacterium]
MRKSTSLSLGRVILALIAVLAVAGPGLVFAQGPGATYPTPRIADILGPSAVPVNGTATYQLEVIFSDGSRVIVDPNATYSARRGTFGSDTAAGAPYTAPSSVGNGRDLLTAVYSNSQGSVRANRVISITGAIP